MDRPPSLRFRRSRRLFWGSLLLLVLSGVLWGCGRGSFIGRQYDNFTAYYNTFYNATEAFEKGLKSVEKSSPDIDRTRYISIFPVPKTQAGGKSFEKAIQKSADVLREHPNSKWVDDALLLIGRSYYYQQNYVGAAQKFREVIALGAEREGEARFRLAQTLIATEQYSEAAEVLSTALEGEEDYGTWTDRMYLVRGELLVRQNRWKDAEQALERGLKGSIPEETAARAAFLLGQVRETIGDFEGAIAAYRRVPDYDPRYPLEFAARLNAIEMQGLHGNTAEALRRLEDLKREDDTPEMRGKMAVVQARLYEAQGRTGKARRVLLNMLRKEKAPRGEARGKIHYELGTLYRDAYKDFTRAAAHFDTSANTLSSRSRGAGSEGSQQSRVLPRAPTDVQKQAERFQTLAKRAKTVARLDSLLRIGRMEPAEFQSFVEKLRERRKKKLEAQAERRRQRQFRAQGEGGQGRTSSRSANAAVDTRGSDAGFLFHRDPTLVQQGRRQFRQVWGDRPLVDNWRRLSAIQAGGATASADQKEEGATESEQLQKQEGSEALIDLSAIPRDSASQAKMEKRLAVARYELGNALFRAAGRPDSAEAWYKRVLEESPDHPVAKRALYALAQSYEAQGDTAAARETYRRVIEKYPKTPFAARSREQLGLDRSKPTADVVESRSDSAYARAYELWRAGAMNTAFDSLLAVAKRYPETDAAPKALLAAGVVYHRALQRDTSKALRGQLRQALGHLTSPDSSSSASVDPTEQEGKTVSAPDSAGADSTMEKKGVPSPSDTSDSDTTGVGPQSDVPSDPATTVSDSTVPASDSTVYNRSSSGDDVVRQDSLRRRKDSTGASSGSVRRRVGTLGDSTAAAPSDTVTGTGVDTSTVAEKGEPADSTTSVQDAPADSVQSDSTRAPSSPPDPIDPLKGLLAYITEQYSGSPHARQAEALLDHLNRQAIESSGSAPDTTVASKTAVSDTSASERATPDTSAGAPRIASDTTRAADTTKTQPLRLDSLLASQGKPPAQTRADSASGKWTLLLRTFEDGGQARKLRRRVQKHLSKRWSVRVLRLPVNASLRYHLTLGLFDSKQKAVQAKSSLREPLSEVATVWALPSRR